MDRFLVFATLFDGRNYLLHFDDFEVFECLHKIPAPEGLWSIAEWPLHTEAEIAFFVELINGNVKSYYILDRKINRKEFVNLNMGS